MLYTSTARFDTTHVLSEDELFRLAPSVFATTAHESRSERFKPIPTIEIVRGLAKEGFQVVGATQGKTRVEGKEDFTKHLLRIRRVDAADKYKVGDNVLEMYLKNANDGTAAYELMAGMFRIRCMNSLVTKTSTLDEIKVRHSGDAIGKVIEGTYEVLKSAETVLQAPEAWGAINLNRRAALALAKGAHVMRFGDSDGNTTTAIEPEQLLIPRRAEDLPTDLWTTFNVIQENAIRGGLEGVTYNDAGMRRKSRTRGITGIDQSVQFNKALWQLTETLAGMVA